MLEAIDQAKAKVRQQIEHVAGRTAKHLAEILWERLQK
jgi:hypothetical protein